MKLTMTAVGLALALGSPAAIVPAAAQQGQPAAAPERKINISKPAQKAVLDLQNAVNANDMATLAEKVAAANAVATTGEDRYYIGALQMRAGLAAKDYAAIAAGIEAMIASNAAPAADLPTLYLNLGKAYNNLKQYDKASPALERAIQLNPNEVDATIMLAENHNRAGRTAEAVGLIQKAIGMRKAAGQSVNEEWYKRALSLAYNAKLPVSIELSRQWAQAYPSAANWRDAIRIYRNMSKPSGEMMLDTLRLARATGALDGEVDFNQYAYTAVDLKNAREAKLLLDEAAAAGKIDANKPLFKEMQAVLKTRPMPDEAILTTNAEKAIAAQDVPAIILTGDRFYGIGNYARAAEMFRSALGKPGADQSLVNLRLGMALALAGDKAGATAALNAVTGARAELAKFWLAYLATKA